MRGPPLKQAFRNNLHCKRVPVGQGMAPRGASALFFNNEKSNWKKKVKKNKTNKG